MSTAKARRRGSVENTPRRRDTRRHSIPLVRVEKVKKGEQRAETEGTLTQDDVTERIRQWLDD